MPEISRFYGIVVKIFFGDHSPPHIHAVYGEHNVLVDIQKGEIIEGDFPLRAKKMILEWTFLHQKELLHMWESQEFYQIAPLE